MVLHTFDATLMIQSYFKLALRALVQNRGLSWLNVGGLALGLLCCGFIALFVRRETTFDRWIPGHQQVYRIAEEIQNFRDGKTLRFAPTAGTVAGALSDFPTVACAVRAVQPFERTLLVSDGAGKSFYEPGCCRADARFFEVFPYPFAEGEAKTALQSPDGAVISERAARKFFGTAEGVLGKTLTIGGSLVRITGVLRDLPETTSIAADFILPMGELGA